jgi:DNA-directed RNA polymerase subunit H (RpoH/RPB5)
MKKVAALTVGANEVFRAIGTPATKQAEPMTKSHPIQAVARSEGAGTGAILRVTRPVGTSGDVFVYRRVT